MAASQTDYYVLWNTDEGARYYEARKERETNTLIYVKYADGTNSYFKKNIVNKTTNDEGLIKVISSDVWDGAHDLIDLLTNSSPPSNGNQVAAQPQEGSGRKRRKRKTRKRKAGMPPKNTTTRDRLREKLRKRRLAEKIKAKEAEIAEAKSLKGFIEKNNPAVEMYREQGFSDDDIVKILGGVHKDEQFIQGMKKRAAKVVKSEQAKQELENEPIIKELLNQPPGSGKPIKYDTDRMHKPRGVIVEGSERMYLKEGGRRKKTRKMKGGHHLYKRLGVSKYASQKQIKKAYNKLKKKKKLTKKVKHAYKILSKKKTRKQYNNRYRKVMKHKRHTRKKRGGNDVWDLKKEYENIMDKYDHDIFWINNAHKGQKAARKFKNVWRKFAGKTKPKNEAQAKVQRNTKLEALKEKAWKLCKPVKEKFEKIKENVEVARSGDGFLTLELKNGEFVDIDPKNIQDVDRPDWNDWTAKLMNEFEREQDRLEAEMHKSGLYGVCDIYDEIEKKLREDEDKENNPPQLQFQ